MNGDIIGKDLQVMEPVSCGQVIQTSEYLYQVKWDGVRMLAFIEEGRVTLINKRHHERTSQYSELQGLPGRLAGRSAVLDGEIVALKGGKPSFPAVMSRDNLRDASRIQQVQGVLPIDYMVFDLLYFEENDLRERPLEERQRILRASLKPGGWLHLVDDFSEGMALFESICSMDMEGIVAKQRSGRYIAGKRHHDWLKIKYRRKASCLIGGYTLRGKTVNSLLLGWEQGDQLLFVGRAGSGLNSEQQRALSSFLPGQARPASPFVNLIRPPTAYHFVEPSIRVDVEFAEWTEEMHLRAPVIKGFID